MKKLILFEFFEEESGKSFKVFTDGTHEGFPPGVSVCNFRNYIEQVRGNLILTIQQVSTWISSSKASDLSKSTDSKEYNSFE